MNEPPADMVANPASPSLSRAEFARLMGVSRSTVTRWIEDGRLTLVDGRIDAEAGRREVEATASPMPHHQARKAQFDEAREAGRAQAAPPGAGKAEAAPPAPAPDGAQQEPTGNEGLGSALKLETYRLQKLKRELAAMEADKMAGALVERTVVDAVLLDFSSALRGLLEGLPDRMAGTLAGHRGDVAAIHHDLDEAAHALMQELSDHMKRKTEVL